jgi:hypothetical protein
LDWKTKVELFEQFREYEFGVGTIAGVGKKMNVRRRIVRDRTLCGRLPPEKASPFQHRCGTGQLGVDGTPKARRLLIYSKVL